MNTPETNSTGAPALSIARVVVLIGAIAVAGVASNVLVPEAARVPVKVALLVAFVFGARRCFDLSWDDLGLDRHRLRPGLRLGALAALAVALAIAVLVAIPATRDFFDSSDVASDSTAEHWLMPLVIIPLGTALFEEMLFRGLLLGVFLRVTTARAAIASSSLLFGVWHLNPALNDAAGRSAAAAVGIVVGTIAATTAAGVLFALLRCRSGSVAAPTLAHAALNGLAYVGALVATGT